MTVGDVFMWIGSIKLADIAVWTGGPVVVIWLYRKLTWWKR